jgi:diguanylate cyclase (GGDEF)-like protein
MQLILSCISESHDQRLLILAALVCTVGVYATSAVARHAGRCEGQSRLGWGLTSIIAAGCTAWATHVIGLLAFNPGMKSGFDPVLTIVSLVAAVLGIGSGVALGLGSRNRVRRFLAGVVIGAGVTALHYLGQWSYRVTGEITWDVTLVAVSLCISLLMFGASMVALGDRSRPVRNAGAPLMLASIAVLHFSGMAAATYRFDPERALPDHSLPPEVVAPVVAGVSLGLLVLAVLGLRLTLAARAAARRDRERLRELASLAVEGLAICDGDVIVTANQSLEGLAGVEGGSLAGRRLASLLPGLDHEDLPEREERDAVVAAADGQLVPVRVLRRDVVLGGKRQAVVAVRDQRERLKTERTIRALAFSDALTGLPNRARFNDLVAAHAAACREHGETLAILLIDLDRFKMVNDTLGHAAGDLVLREVAGRLNSIATEHDIVARLGGDEFAVLCRTGAAARSVADLGHRMIAVVEQPFSVRGQSVHIGASIGAAFAPEHGDGPEILLRNADLALYKAKADGKGVFRAFEPELDRQARERQQLEAELRTALVAGEFELHYQPLVDASSRAVTGAEALVRWRHPKRGLVPPADFIPVAEECGLIGALGQWVLRTACLEASRWPAHIRVAVNLSPAQFRDPHLVDAVRDALTAAGLPATRLELEITEGVLLRDEDRTLATLMRLRAMGLGLSMDDFGTGYSSLSYLRRFPFNKIKVDRSFVRNLPSDAESAAIVRAIVTLGSCLGMSTTIEGVESAEQFAFAAAEGFDQVQGYHVSRPLPADGFLAFVQDIRAAA